MTSVRRRYPLVRKCANFLTNGLLMTSCIFQISILLYLNATERDLAIDSEMRSYSSTTPHQEIAVDILSIGSESRLEYTEAQRNTFATHRSVRNFFSVTEKDDADPFCSTNLSISDVTEISKFCRRNAKWTKKQFLMTYLKRVYAREQFLLKKSNPQGWMCAQTRPAQGIYKVLQTYKTRNESFPDFLIMMDDDTYYNMKLFVEHFKRNDSSDSLAIAGCRVRSPINQINWTFPFGGYGLVMSKGWLERMVEPILCPRDSDFCQLIRRANPIGERKVFRSGMTIADIIYSYTIHQPFSEYRNWTTGFCLHSDWLLGYVTNFYNVSRHVSDMKYASVPQARLDAYLDSEITAGSSRHGGRHLCDFLRGNCHSKAHVCHYSTPAEMAAITEIVKKRNPEEFRAEPNACVNCEKEGFHLNQRTVIIDFLSFAKNDSDLRAQKEVVESQNSIRSFHSFSANSHDDRLCFGSQADIEKIIKDCKETSAGSDRKWFLNGLRSLHSRGKDPASSWRCEQRIFIRGISEALSKYTSEMRNNGTMLLPDYLILADSGTYWNFDVFREMLRNIALEVKNSRKITFNKSVPVVVGGCTREYQVFKTGYFFRVPMLSHGIIISRGMLDRLLKPIYCNTTQATDLRCQIIHESQLWEVESFQDGMTPVELMTSNHITNALGTCFEAERYVKKLNLHRTFINNLKTHMLGRTSLLSYVLQFYAGTKSSTLPLHESLSPSDAMSRIYLKSTTKRSGPEMLCRYQDTNCNVDAPYCSHISADRMLTYTRLQKRTMSTSYDSSFRS